MLEALLDKYADEGVAHIEEAQILTIAPFTEFGTRWKSSAHLAGWISISRQCKSWRKRFTSCVIPA